MFDMKKFVLTAGVLVMLPTAAFANITAGISYKGYIGNNDTPDANAYEITLGKKIMDNLTVDIQSEFVDFNNSLTGNSLEAGLTPSYQFTDYPVGLYGRAALGNQWFSGTGVLNDSESFGYGSIEPGLFYSPYKNSSTGVSLGYRFRGAFDDQPDYNTNAIVLKGQYQIDAHNVINGGYEFISSVDDSDIQSNMISVGYIAKF